VGATASFREGEDSVCLVATANRCARNLIIVDGGWNAAPSLVRIPHCHGQFPSHRWNPGVLRLLPTVQVAGSLRHALGVRGHRRESYEAGACATEGQRSHARA
jgi:hypothetical protein